MAGAGGDGRMPCVYINHGGGPMPLLDKQPRISEFLRGYAATLPSQPTAVVVITAHWETSQVTVSAAEKHGLLFDYGGFPPETYKYEYPAPGAPALAQRIQKLLADQSLPCSLDTERGWDHGVFVPLMLMFPEATVPVVAVSVLETQDAAANIAVGEALQPLRDEGVLIVGSGASFHNFQHMFAKGEARAVGEAHAANFDRWLQQTVTSGDVEDGERRARLAEWSAAPSRREAHPEGAAEHFMPFFTVFGAGGAAPPGRALGVEAGLGPKFGNFAFSQFEWA